MVNYFYNLKVVEIIFFKCYLFLWCKAEISEASKSILICRFAALFNLFFILGTFLIIFSAENGYIICV